MVELRGGDESFLGESRGIGEVRGEETLQGHDVRAEAVDLEVIALADPFISGEANGMGPVVTSECRFESLELDPIRFFRVPLRLLDLGDEARVHEFLPLRIRFGVGKAPASKRV
jgi:hypothetical protein